MLYKSPHYGHQNIISFTCSDAAVKKIVTLLKELEYYGKMGSTINLNFSWDGDGSDGLHNISVNGLSMDAWDKEWCRLSALTQRFKDSQLDDE